MRHSCNFRLTHKSGWLVGWDFRGELQTPFADHCVPGITRHAVLHMAPTLGIPAREMRLTLADVYAADEMFVTGTMGELTPVVLLDGRAIGSGGRGPVTAALQVPCIDASLSTSIRRLPFLLFLLHFFSFQAGWRLKTEGEGEPLPTSH
jgi:hypothetical protein